MMDVAEKNGRQLGGNVEQQHNTEQSKTAAKMVKSLKQAVAQRCGERLCPAAAVSIQIRLPHEEGVASGLTRLNNKVACQ